MGESAAKDFRREVAAFCAAERALSDDPGIGQGEDGGGDVLAAGFAADGEVAEPGGGEVEHRSIIGEYKAKICTGGLRSAGCPFIEGTLELAKCCFRLLTRKRFSVSAGLLPTEMELRASQLTIATYQAIVFSSFLKDRESERVYGG